MVGKTGLIMSRPCRRNPGKTVVRFIMDRALQSDDQETEGFETSAGDLTYEEYGQIALQTKRSRYVFSFEKDAKQNAYGERKGD